MKAPKISIQIGADTKKLKRDMKKADGIVSKFSTAAKWGLAGAASAAGAFAFSLGKQGVEAAIEDAASQRVLAKTLQNTTKATDEQVKATEDYISATSLAFGIADDKLRPAMARLVRSTKNASEAQKLLNLALDISAATGKDIQTVTTALAKGYDGNAASLGRLGLGLDASVLKSKNFNDIFNALRKNFKGFAEQEASTTEGKIRRLNVAWDETTEAVGTALLPELEKFSDWAVSADGQKAITDGLATMTEVIKGLADAFSMLIEKKDALMDFMDAAWPDDLKERMSWFESHLDWLAPDVAINQRTQQAIPNSPRGSSGFRTTGGAPVNINITGAVDPGATGRQVKKILNQTNLNAVSPKAGDRRR